MNLLYSINASFTVVRIFKLCYDDRIRRGKQNKRRGDRMDLLIKIGIFAVAALVLNYVVNIIYKYILKSLRTPAHKNISAADFFPAALTLYF